MLAEEASTSSRRNEPDAARAFDRTRDGLEAAVAHSVRDTSEQGEVHRARETAVLRGQDVEGAVPQPYLPAVVGRLEAFAG